VPPQGLTKGAVDVRTEVGRAGTIGVAWNRALEPLEPLWWFARTTHQKPNTLSFL
jgi:hypothetical protein